MDFKEKIEEQQQKIFHKTIHLLPRSKVEKIEKKMSEGLKLYTARDVRKQKTFVEIKKQNQMFAKDFNAMKKHRKNKDTLKFFRELFAEYKKKNYKIPNINLDHNIFNLNPLLAGNKNTIKNYYLLKTHEINGEIDSLREKNVLYLNKGEAMIEEKRAKNQKKLDETRERANTTGGFSRYQEDFSKENEELQSYCETIEYLLANKREFENRKNRTLTNSTALKQNQKSRKFGFLRGQSEQISFFKAKSPALQTQTIFRTSNNSSNQLISVSNVSTIYQSSNPSTSTTTHYKPKIKSKPANLKAYSSLIDQINYRSENLSKAEVLEKICSLDKKLINYKYIKPGIDAFVERFKRRKSNVDKVLNSEWGIRQFLSFAQRVKNNVNSYDVSEVWKNKVSNEKGFDFHNKLKKVGKLDRELKSLDKLFIKKNANLG